MVVEKTVADQRGGALLVPFIGRFSTVAAGGQQPVVASLSPAVVSSAGGTVVATGTALSGVTAVRVGTLSVTPSKSTIAFGGEELNTWVAADSVSLLNDGASAGTLLARTAGRT